MSSRRRVLVIDDSEADRLEVTRLLSLTPDLYVIRGAGSIADGLALAGELPFELVICDWELPDGSGADFAARQMAQGLLLPVVIVTGVARPELHEAALRSGAVEILPKDQLSQQTLLRVAANLVRAVVKDLVEASTDTTDSP